MNISKDMNEEGVETSLDPESPQKRLNQCPRCLRWKWSINNERSSIDTDVNDFFEAPSFSLKLQSIDSEKTIVDRIHSLINITDVKGETFYRFNAFI